MTSTSYPGVMVSSTFTDLSEHRAALIKALNSHGFMHVSMEDSSARADVDVIGSSLEMVRRSAAYALVISHKYGQTPEDAERNPEKLSLTELEFNEAEKLGRPVLLFIMGQKHPVTAADVEVDPEKRAKLDAFRERAKRWSQDSEVERVYALFNNLHEFEVKASEAVAALRRYLDEHRPVEDKRDFIPSAPAFYAEPPYIGSHRFVGRQAQLETLSDWALAADPHPVMLFEAIGGAGKSMLTWEWTTHHATIARTDWVGRFWYSFYERGAVMADFCRRALAYMTGRPLEDFRKKKMAELSDLLLRELRQRPWLLVLDGLERVLVAYHRFDAAQVADEDVGSSSDQIARRDPCAAIRPEDDDLLRALAAAAPSKLLLTSRLIPRVLLNPASQPIPGVLHDRLPGLRPADAEALLRSCGVSGDSQAIQRYLKSHCDCHPLVTGVLAGLINDYLPHRGNFDAWASAPEGGAALNLAELDLIQRRNHILKAALNALPEKGRQLLSTLALLSEAVDYETLSAFNPHLDEPDKSGGKAKQELKATVRDLEQRGLLQYDAHHRYYDLHPVVRGIAAGGLRQDEKATYGQRVVDHFSRQSDNPYEDAETLGDVSNGLHVVRTLLQMGRYQEAADAYDTELSTALLFNLEAYATAIALLGAFFTNGWNTPPQDVDPIRASSLATGVGIALAESRQHSEALIAFGTAIDLDLRNGEPRALQRGTQNFSLLCLAQGRLAAAFRCSIFAFELASHSGEDDLFSTLLQRLEVLALQGSWSEAEEVWKILSPMTRPWDRGNYRPGDAEFAFAVLQFRKGELLEEDLRRAENLAKGGKNRNVKRKLHVLRGEWLINQCQWNSAASSLHEAVLMAREIGQSDGVAEAQFTFAKLQLGQLADPRREAEHLSMSKYRSDVDLASLWLAIGDRDKAKKHALAAYKWAWADGEPYVRRYELTKSRALLEQLGVKPPTLPPYDPAKDPPFPWEAAVRETIEQLKVERRVPNDR